MLNPKNFWPAYNFGAVSAELADFSTAQFVVMPVPYDATTTWRGGTREGPSAILEASMNMELFDVELKREICDCGIHTTADVEPLMSGPEDMAERIRQVVGEVLEAGKFPVMLGGEHSLTLGAVRAAVEHNPQKKLTVLQLDAHTDLREKYSGTRFGHGAVTRRMSELPGVNIIQVGLRSTSLQEHLEVPLNVTQFWCEDVLPNFQESLKEILASISSDVYITFDVDVCDPSWIASTGTPEPGGFSYYQVRDILRAVCQNHHVVGLDCVELCGGDHAAAYGIARLLYKTMGYLSQLEAST